MKHPLWIVSALLTVALISHERSALASDQSRASVSSDVAERGSTASPLTFEEVARSVQAHHPRIERAIQDARRAKALNLRARGAFDPTVRANASATTGAYYDLWRLDTELRQPTTLWGSELYVGYRMGLGLNERFPPYYSDETLSKGEVRAGLELPVWRDGLIDGERAERTRTAREADAAERSLEATRLGLELAAARAYWSWVSAGQQLRVTDALVELAEQRDAQLRRKLQAGSIAEFDVIDNERILLERRDGRVAASRALERAALELSMFVRDQAGRTLVPSMSRLPSQAAPLTPVELDPDEAVIRVIGCHPEVAEIRAKLEAAKVELRLAKNRLAPELNLIFQVSRDLGDLNGTSLDFTLPGTVFDAGLTFSMPLALRAERGTAQAARANVEGLKAEVRLLEDALGVRTQDAASALQAAQARVALMTSVVETTERLAQGERRRFEAGSSNLIFVNLREQIAAAAQMRYVEAVAGAHIEQTRWRVTTSCGGDTLPGRN